MCGAGGGGRRKTRTPGESGPASPESDPRSRFPRATGFYQGWINDLPMWGARKLGLLGRFQWRDESRPAPSGMRCMP